MTDPFMGNLHNIFEEKKMTPNDAVLSAMEYPEKVLDPRTVPPQPFPYQISKFSETLIKDADGIAVFSMCNGNQQGMVTRDLILDTLNFFTEAEALAEISPAVAGALAMLRNAVMQEREAEAA